MNITPVRFSVIIILCALLSALCGSDALAQARRAGGATAVAPAAAKEGVVIRKVDVIKVRSPDYSTSLNEVTLTPGDWAKILVRFDTDADWTDQLEMRFYIVVKNPKTSAYTMFTATYVYSEIPRGRGHQVAVYLRPRTSERYGWPEQAGVEIYSKGEVVSAGSFPESNKPWWKTANVRTVEGYVLDRSQTPFANIATDNYELPKGK